MTNKTETLALPNGIGPHEGKELELMLAGKKPLAMFYDAVIRAVSDSYSEEDFMPHVEAGRMVRRDEIYQPKDGSLAGHYVYYALPSEEWRIDELHEINRAGLVEGRPWTDEHERRVGYLLGYTESEISAWLART